MAEHLTHPGGAPVAVQPCAICGNPVAHDALFCPACGTTFRRRRGPDHVLIAAGVLAIIVGVLLALLLSQDNGNDTPTTAQTLPATTTISSIPVVPGITTPTTATIGTTPTTATFPTTAATVPTTISIPTTATTVPTTSSLPSTATAP